MLGYKYTTEELANEARQTIQYTKYKHKKTTSEGWFFYLYLTVF